MTGAASRELNVLIVDDEQTVHGLYAAFLRKDKKNSYRIFHAMSGEEGLELYATHPIDCILLDNNLPRMSGLDVLLKMSVRDKILPAVMLTGEGNEDIAVAAMKLGVQDYVPKRAVTSNALQRAVQRAAERAAMLRRLDELHREMERSNHDLEQFATVVAHDLKAPLRAVSQHLSLIRHSMDGRLGPDDATSLDFALEGAARMGELIDALFSYARLGFVRPELAEIDAGKALDDALANLTALISHRNARITRSPLPRVKADAPQLVQLFQNLIGNALKFCNSAPEIRVEAKPDGDAHVFSVGDNGIGIAPESQEKVFVIFQRLHDKNAYEGTGVGLAVCQRVVTNHGGRIWLSSAPGKGSTFFFTLPAVTENRKKALSA